MNNEIHYINQLQTIINGFSPISIEQAEAASLMNRIDEKFIFNINLLPEILKKLAPFYHILEINGNRISTYQNQYFDTPNYSFYYAHHNGLANRLKVRNRQYVESGIAFMELKRKNNKQKTIKLRVKVSNLNEAKPTEGKSFLQKHLPQLESQLITPIKISFSRISLVSKNFTNRCSFDIMLKTQTATKTHDFNKLVIAELKKESINANTNANLVFRQFKLTKQNFSKYCMGMAATVPGLKKNTFKPTFLTLKKLQIGNH